MLVQFFRTNVVVICVWILLMWGHPRPLDYFVTIPKPLAALARLISTALVLALSTIKYMICLAIDLAKQL